MFIPVFAVAEENVGITIGVIIALSFLISLIICLVWRAKMKTARIQKKADSYISQGGFSLTGREDKFLYKTKTRRYVGSKN